MKFKIYNKNYTTFCILKAIFIYLLPIIITFMYNCFFISFSIGTKKLRRQFSSHTDMKNHRISKIRVVDYYSNDVSRTNYISGREVRELNSVWTFERSLKLGSIRRETMPNYEMLILLSEFKKQLRVTASIVETTQRQKSRHVSKVCDCEKGYSGD